jgi:hypothetical protein
LTKQGKSSIIKKEIKLAAPAGMRSKELVYETEAMALLGTVPADDPSSLDGL